MKIVCDYHIHSRHSPEEECKSTMQQIVEVAISSGIRSFGVSDHLHAKVNVPALESSKTEFQKVKGKVNFYFGVEVSCLRQWDLEENEKPGNASIYGVHEGGPQDSPLTIYLPDDLMQRINFDYVIGGAHWPLGASYKQEEIILSYHRQNMFLSTHPKIDIVAHPWWWMGHWQNEQGNYTNLPWLGDFSVIPDSMHKEFAQAVIENNKAVEINACAIFLNPKYPDKFKQDYILYLKKLKKWGVTFSLGSDAHSIEAIGSTLKIAYVLEEIGLVSDLLWHPFQKINKEEED